MATDQNKVLRPLTNEEEETQQVIKVMSQVGTVLAFLAGVCAMVGIIMPWWTMSSELLEVNFNSTGTETTLDGAVTLWDFDLLLLLPPAEGEQDGEEMEIQTTWDSMCADAAATQPSVPATCGTVIMTRAFIVLTAILSSTAAVFIVLAKRFTPLLLLGGILAALVAAFFAASAAFMGVLMSTAGLNGWGFLFTGGSMVLNVLCVAAVFYTAIKAMPGADSEAEASRGSRLKRAQDASGKAAEMAKQLEMGMGVRKKERQKLGEESTAPVEKKKHAMLKRVIFWENESEGDE